MREIQRKDKGRHFKQGLFYLQFHGYVKGALKAVALVVNLCRSDLSSELSVELVSLCN